MLTGERAAAPLFVSAAPDVTADVYAVGAAAFADTLQGGAGNDRLDGDWSAEPASVEPADTVNGGAGNDQLVVGGAGTADGGPGDDFIYAHDGTYDAIDCGPDVDTVHRDPTDTIFGCEDDPDALAFPHPIAIRVQTATIPLAFRGTTRVKVTSKGTIHVAVRCPRGATCAGRLRLVTGKVVLGAATCTVKGDKTVTLELNRAALKLLDKRKHHTLTATLSLMPGHLTAAPKPRRITLSLPRRR
jgi:hypothetical protein